MSGRQGTHSRSDPFFHFAMGQANFAVLSDQATIGSQQNSRVVDQMPIALIETQHDMEGVLFGKLTKVIGRWSGNGFGGLVDGLSGQMRGRGWNGFPSTTKLAFCRAASATSGAKDSQFSRAVGPFGL